MVILGNDFHFLGYNGFLQFFRPLVPGVKRQILFFFKIFSVFLWHKAYKTIQKRTSVGIVPPPPNKMATPSIINEYMKIYFTP